MKNIYIVLTYTGTALARLIKIYTKKKYAHVSISLDKELNKMYSFGRLNAYNPFRGGFVKENPEYGTFKRFKNTDSIIYEIPVTDEQYSKIEEEIKYISKNRKEYKFNTIGLFLAGFDKKLNRKNCFYCAEFVKYIIEKSKVETNLPRIITPSDFHDLKNSTVIYQGKLKTFNLYLKKLAIN